MPDRLKDLFIGPDGTLRFVWRVVIFYAVGSRVLFPLLSLLIGAVGDSLSQGQGLSAGAVAADELVNFFVALICTGAFAYYEQRRIDSYGLSIERALSRQTLEGVVAGVVMAGAVAIGMLTFGGMQIRGFGGTASTLSVSAFTWLVANICVGISEEFWFRSYLQQTLWKSIGFWPSATVIALVFAAEHYFFKDGENIWDVITLVSLSLLLSYSMLRTGTLWFAVGFHIAFDYMQLFIIGTPNGNRIPAGRLLDTTFKGPVWLTGGVLGTEASFLMYPAIALLWLYVWWRYRSNPSLQV